jgi:Lar family restriction alleviation protein
MTQNTELLPCPFCGAHAETDFIPEHHSYAIECYSIGCAARVIKETSEDAIAAWNRRAPAAQVPTKVTADMRRAFREAYREGGFWTDRLDYALDRMLAAAPQPPEARKPLTDEKIAEGMATCDVAPGDAELGTFTEGVRFAERVRGITGETT